MGNTISIEQLDGMIAEQERARETIRLKVVAMQELKALFFGADASGGGQPSVPRTEKTQTVEAPRKMNECQACHHRWPRGGGRQKRSCPKCGTDNWQG